MQRTQRVLALASRFRFRIGAVLVEPHRLVVSLDGQETALEPRVMEVLVALAEHAGEVVSAEQLLVEVWRGTFYGDNPVHKAIAHLRKVLADDLRSPRYIETIRKRGYRLIARVYYPDDYQRAPIQSVAWAGASPYVGLNPFDAEHAGVYFGRSRATAALLGAIRAQIDAQRRLVLIVGASGCGKTSLLNAGVLPLLCQDSGFDGLQALSVARCDLAGVRSGDALAHLAAALSHWQLDRRPVFAKAEGLAEHFRLDPASIGAAIGEAFARSASRELNAKPYAHLFLLIDHAESLVADGPPDVGARDAFSRALQALCDSPRVMVAMTVRGDYYLALVEGYPEIAERKQGDGHFDVLAPRSGEIAQIIRSPAALAGLSFEEDTQTAERLDDVLRDASQAHADALPMLQHTLQALYERRSADGVLGFDAFRTIGGLEGALAHQADKVHATLGKDAADRLPGVLAQLIVMHPDSESISARRVEWSALNAGERALAEAFVRARLFVAEMGGHEPGFRVAHEALLRQWPRARDWIEDNRRRLQSKARFRRAAARWVEDGRSADLLLNPGRPLEDAQEVARLTPEDLRPEDIAFLQASVRSSTRRRRMRAAAVVSLAIFAVVSAASAIIAATASREAEARRESAMQLSDFMLVELAEKLRPLGNLNLLGSISEKALAELERQPEAQMQTDDLLNRSRALRTVGEVLLAEAKLADARSAFERASEAAARARAQTPDATAAILEQGTAEYWLGYYYFRQFQLAQARPHWDRYLEASERLVAIDPGNDDWQIELSYALNNLGGIVRDQGRISDALPFFTRSAQIKADVLARRPDDAALRFDLIDTLSWISSGDESEGRLAEAAAGYAEQIEMLRQLVIAQPDALVWQRRLSTLQLSSAKLALARGEFEHAQEEITQCIERLTKLTHQEPSNLVWARDLANAFVQASDIASATHDRRNQRAHALAAQDLIQRNRAAADSSLALRRLAAVNLLQIARSSEPFDVEIANRAVAELERIATESTRRSNEILALGKALIERGRQSRQIGRTALAANDAKRVIELLENTAPLSNNPETVALWVSAHELIGSASIAEMRYAWLRTIGYRHPFLNISADGWAHYDDVTK